MTSFKVKLRSSRLPWRSRLMLLSKRLVVWSINWMRLLSQHQLAPKKSRSQQRRPTMILSMSWKSPWNSLWRPTWTIRRKQSTSWKLALKKSLQPILRKWPPRLKAWRPTWHKKTSSLRLRKLMILRLKLLRRRLQLTLPRIKTKWASNLLYSRRWKIALEPCRPARWSSNSSM